MNKISYNRSLNRNNTILLSITEGLSFTVLATIKAILEPQGVIKLIVIGEEMKRQ